MNTIKNMDMASLADRFVIFGKEITISNSAGTVEFVDKDKERALQYLAHASGFLEAIAKPVNPLDLSTTDRTTWPVKEFIADERIEEIENIPIKDIVRRFKACYLQASKCNSKDRTSGINGDDKERLVKLIANTKEIIEFAGSEGAALDLPRNPRDIGPTPPLSGD